MDSPTTRSRTHLLVVASIVMAVALASAACGSETSTTDSPAPETPSPAASVGEIADWSDVTVVAELGDGFSMAACEGDAPLLCITRDSEIIGVVEGLRFPLASFTNLDPNAAVGDNLRTIAADFVETLRADRAAGCPSGYTLEALPVVDFVLGGTEALSYGYVGTNADGSPSELNLQYATIDGGDIVLVAAIAYDEGGCPGRDDLASFDSATLAELRTRLEVVFRDMPLPPPLPTG